MAKVVGAKGEKLSSYPQEIRGSGIWRGLQIKQGGQEE